MTGAAGAGALFCVVFVLSRTVLPVPPAFRVARIDRESDVTMNNTADIVVALDNNVADPRGPNAVWDPIPPKAPAKSAALPLCNKTTMIRNMHTITWMMVRSTNIALKPV